MNSFSNIILIVCIGSVLTNEPITYVNTKSSDGILTHYYPPKYYIKLQNPSHFEYTDGSNRIFVQVPGLVLSFHHQTPMLYEINFHGECRIDSQQSWLFLRIRVDGNLIMGNTLVPNMANDTLVDGTSLHSNANTPGAAFPCSKIDWIYLSAGTHVVDVVARLANSGRIAGGSLKIKLTQFDSANDINLPIMTPQTRAA
ncbi:unnamed protein product [Adineta ricciae]|uniref:Uncharacterized protein n=1 Tax=Adineta ricciae TaxID=249248 RepID=A0A814T1X7_ADIRI|nr:unnamed protein product [Adineta ricciae]CAF1296603.1 unnamed protein product [Adineta ricciae]